MKQVSYKQLDWRSIAQRWQGWQSRRRHGFVDTIGVITDLPTEREPSLCGVTPDYKIKSLKVKYQ